MAVKVDISAEERAALCEVVENQKLSLKTVAAHLAEKEWDKAEEVFRHFTQDCRLLEGLRLKRASDSTEITLPMGGLELRETLNRMVARRTARQVAGGSLNVPSPDREAFQDKVSLAISVCERCLKTLTPRYEVRYVVVDAETGDPEEVPLVAYGFALDLCDLLNEKSAYAKADRP